MSLFTGDRPPPPAKRNLLRDLEILGLAWVLLVGASYTKAQFAPLAMLFAGLSVTVIVVGFSACRRWIGRLAAGGAAPGDRS
jgi:hypothetical protein